MQGVTTAIVAFIFAGVIWPHLIKHKVQFYAGLIVVLFIILMDSVGQMFFKDENRAVVYGVVGLLQIAGIVLLVLSAGMSAKELGGEVFNTIEVVRRGGEKETIIVPLRGEQPKARDRSAPAARVEIDPESHRPVTGGVTRNGPRDIAAEEAALDAAEGVGPPVLFTPPVAPPVPPPVAPSGPPSGAPPLRPPGVQKPDADRSIPIE